jgi:hypothetical protein
LICVPVAFDIDPTTFWRLPLLNVIELISLKRMTAAPSREACERTAMGKQTEWSLFTLLVGLGQVS